MTTRAEPEAAHALEGALQAFDVRVTVKGSVLVRVMAADENDARARLFTEGAEALLEHDLDFEEIVRVTLPSVLGDR